MYSYSKSVQHLRTRSSWTDGRTQIQLRVDFNEAYLGKKKNIAIDFDVLLTVHLSRILVINQLNTQIVL